MKHNDNFEMMFGLRRATAFQLLLPGTKVLAEKGKGISMIRKSLIESWPDITTETLESLLDVAREIQWRRYFWWVE